MRFGTPLPLALYADAESKQYREYSLHTYSMYHAEVMQHVLTAIH